MMRGPTPTSSQLPPSQPISASKTESSGQYSFIDLLLQKKMLSTFLLSFRLEVDLHEFGPEDIDISVEGKWA